MAILIVLGIGYICQYIRWEEIDTIAKILSQLLNGGGK